MVITPCFLFKNVREGAGIPQLGLRAVGKRGKVAGEEGSDGRMIFIPDLY